LYPSPTSSSIVCIHGFGGNADQFRKNLPFLSKSLSADCYAVDLLGYGYSDKPDPRDSKWGGVNRLYNFENWADQVISFIRDIVKKDKPVDHKVILVCNSVGGVCIPAFRLF